MSLPALFIVRSLLLPGGLIAAFRALEASNPSPPAPPEPATAVTRPSSLPRPGSLDLRIAGGAAFLPPSVEAGASAELGVLPIGSGTLSAGAELSINQCLLACSATDLFSQREVSNRDLYVLGRVGYHFALPVRNKRTVDLSGFLLAGMMEAHTTVTAPDERYEGRGRGPAFGLGMGGNYFLSPRFFVGGEARLRFGAGSYTFTVSRGSPAFTREDHHWVRPGLGTVIFAGVRLF
ncbi:hypothetical protein [Vitiosangium sp. GDMCC 1.1324]|uniref:hypothetical protein n=1 Tax=Vitiosangium sp. (strain GDMCC 1.1324) TaxID=2138576 RepID=UPI000D34FDB1|nr:hypothetical protein [Vitiosangium sp. GDMCC 1.1324]PTL79131.1 hypothetical protein DAT35_36620 [Vitiosangium sp. GDMCC 1.1324]